VVGDKTSSCCKAIKQRPVEIFSGKMMMLRYLTEEEQQEAAAALRKIGWSQKRIAKWLKQQPRSIHEELMRKDWLKRPWDE